jgi:hypothetical protein
MKPFRFRANILHTCAIIAGVILLLAVLYWVYRSTVETFELNCISSSVDGNTYCVRDSDRQQESADLLAQVTTRMQTLVSHLAKQYPANPAVSRLKSNFNPEKISEILPDSDHVAFTENKKKMSFCLTEKKKGDSDTVDINTLMFVCLHEMSHMATASIGHGTEFWTNFKFILEEAQSIGIYDPQNYKEEPTEYCSMKINSSPLFE